MLKTFFTQKTIIKTDEKADGFSSTFKSLYVKERAQTICKISPTNRSV